ncbi:MAG TPA: GMC family oxidoreductase [Polyangiaceae bacterium]|nr:GMC family oxidoreductase [Polyangiaceae bacterium]
MPSSRQTIGADEVSIRRLSQILSTLPRPAARGVGAAFVLLDETARLATGKPFRDLTRAEQDALLGRWERNPIVRPALYGLGLLAKSAHFDALHAGKRAHGLAVVSDARPTRGDENIVRADDWAHGPVIECDVVVVGTGAGGAVVGRELADRGFVVCFVEEGARYRREDFGRGLIQAQTKLYRTTFAWGSPPIPLMMGRLVGGSTAVNGGTCLRTPDFILDEWCERLHTDDLSPANMAARFAHVEERLIVAEPERRHIGPIADIMDRGAAAFGWHSGPIPRNAVGCEGQGFCGLGCATGARRSTELSFLPGALAQGSTVLCEARATALIREGGRAVGVEVVSPAGRALSVRGKAVIFAGGAIPTPLFLLRQGVANSSGELGRNLSLHPSAGVGGYFDERVDPENHVPQGYMVDHFLRDNILLLAAQPTREVAHTLFPTTGQRLMQSLDAVPHLGMLGVMIRDSTRGRVWRDVGGQPLVTYNLCREDVALMKRALVYAGELCRAAGARRLHIALVGQKAIDSDAEFEHFKARPLKASELALISYHPLGTCKMGRDPKSSVVNLDHETHDVPGLFVVDGSSVPGPPGVNPQLTIMALATRAAERIAARLS